ncbi:hypothetical protein J6590_049996 [Homalodisca vitripennis]|nr:hypothetical protein J6590_049996 [Homalodisca vitripennis]
MLEVCYWNSRKSTEAVIPNRKAQRIKSVCGRLKSPDLPYPDSSWSLGGGRLGLPGSDRPPVTTQSTVGIRSRGPPLLAWIYHWEIAKLADAQTGPPSGSTALSEHPSTWLKKSKSTIAATIDLMKTIIDTTEGTPTTNIPLDLSEAFDSLNYKHFLNYKLEVFKEQWFQGYLRGRTHMIEVTHLISNKSQKTRLTQVKTTRCLSQGSALVPVLLIPYTNDNVSVLNKNCEVLLYAE